MERPGACRSFHGNTVPRSPTELARYGCPFVFLSLALIKLISRNYIYWELDSGGLHARKIWGKREFVVAWDKVVAVRNFIPGISWDGRVSVYYEPPIPTNGFRYVVTTPERRNEFIAALREFAPHAKFEV
jgi:hypothetical protein